MKYFYIRSKDTPLTTAPSDKESDATMIFRKDCDISDAKCPVIDYLKGLCETYYAPNSVLQQHCFNFAPDKQSIDLLRKFGEESQNICTYCQYGTKNR